MRKSQHSTHVGYTRTGSAGVLIWSSTLVAVLLLAGPLYAQDSPPSVPDTNRLSALENGFDYESDVHQRGVLLWESELKASLIAILSGHTAPVNSVAFSPDGQSLVSGSDDETVRTWDAETGEQLLVLEEHSDAVNSVEYSPSGTVIISGSSDSDVIWWSTDGDVEWAGTFPRPVFSATISANGNMMAVGTGTSVLSLPPRPSVYVYDLIEGGPPIHVLGPVGTDGFYLSLSFSPTADTLATGLQGLFSGRSELWEMEAGELVHTLDTITARSVVITPDGNFVVTGSGQNARKWHLDSGDEMYSLEGHTGDVTAVAISPDSGFIATGSSDKTIRLWDAATGALVQTLSNHAEGINDIDISPDGNRVAAATESGNIYLWEIALVVGPTVSHVEPNPVTGSDSSQPFTIHGQGFEENPNVILRHLPSGNEYPDREISSWSDTEIVINPVFTTEPATWSVEVINPDGRTTGKYEFEVLSPDDVQQTIRLVRVEVDEQGAGITEHTPWEAERVDRGDRVRVVGIVTDQDGEPVAGANVQAFNPYDYDPENGSSGVESVHTDSLGHFYFPSAETWLETDEVIPGPRGFWFDSYFADDAIPFVLYVHDPTLELEYINDVLAETTADFPEIHGAYIDTTSHYILDELDILGSSYPVNDSELDSPENDDFFLYYYAIYFGPVEVDGAEPSLALTQMYQAQPLLIDSGRRVGQWLTRGVEHAADRTGRYMQLMSLGVAEARDRAIYHYLNPDLTVLTQYAATTTLCAAGLAGAVGTVGASAVACKPLVVLLATDASKMVMKSDAARSIMQGDLTDEEYEFVVNSTLSVSKLLVGLADPVQLTNLTSTLTTADIALKNVRKAEKLVSAGTSTWNALSPAGEQLRDDFENIRGGLLSGFSLLQLEPQGTNDELSDTPLSLALANAARPDLSFQHIAFDDPNDPTYLSLEVVANDFLFERGHGTRTVPELTIGGEAFALQSIDQPGDLPIYKVDIPVSSLPNFDPSNVEEWSERVATSGYSYVTLFGAANALQCGIGDRQIELIGEQLQTQSGGPEPSNVVSPLGDGSPIAILDVPDYAFGGDVAFVQLRRASYDKAAEASQSYLQPRSPVIEVNAGGRSFSTASMLTLSLRDVPASEKYKIHLYARTEDSHWHRLETEVNLSDNTARAEIHDDGYYAAFVSIRHQEVPVAANRDFADPTDNRNYRLVGLPGEANLDVGQTLSGTPGQHWRAFYDDGSDDDYLVEYDGSEAFAFGPGKGFWILSESAWQVDDTFDAVELENDGTARLPLHAGWNILSNPFDRDIPWSTVQELNDLDEALWRWDGSWQQVSTFSSAIDGEAFYVLNDADFEELALPYYEGSEPTTAPAARLEDASSLRLRAMLAGEELASVETGVAATARQHAAPPGYFAAAELTISGQQRPIALLHQARSESNDGYAFELALRAEPGTAIELEGEGTAAMEYEAVVLLEETTGRRHDLRDGAPIRIFAEQEVTPLRVLMGTAEYVAGEATPDQVSLLPNYPNPFSTRTTLEYTLSEPMNARLEVYDILGRRVALLVDEEQPAGFYTEVWDGRDQSGVPLASGVYFVRLTAGDAISIEQVTLVR